MKGLRFGSPLKTLWLTHPCRALKDVEDLLLSDGLVGGLWVGLGCWSEDGVNVGIN